jgi:hypothetical protein
MMSLCANQSYLATTSSRGGRHGGGGRGRQGAYITGNVHTINIAAPAKKRKYNPKWEEMTVQQQVSDIFLRRLTSEVNQFTIGYTKKHDREWNLLVCVRSFST